MKDNKGILGRLLFIVGIALVAVGVFVFQGMSRAEDDGMPAAAGDVGVSIPSDSVPGTDGDHTTNGESTGLEESGEPTETAAEYTYVVKYYTKYKENEEPTEIQTYTGVESEYEFEIVATEPEVDGDFLGWYEYEHETIGNYYHAGDKIVLNSEKPELILVAKDATLKNYTLRYNLNGGVNAPATQVCQSYYGDCEFLISNMTPSKEGHEFRGWALNGDESVIYAPGTTIKTKPNEEIMTLYAAWAEIKTYTLMYDVNGGSGAPEIQTCKSSNGSCRFVITAVTPYKTSAEFLGWRRGSDLYTDGMEIVTTETNTILIASWNPIYKFTLTYTAEEGTQNLPDSQKCETTMGNCTFIVSTKEPTREGYNFMGWRWPDKEDMLAKGGDEIVVAIDGKLDLEMKAVWSKIYTVLNSGEVFGAGERVILRSTAEVKNFQKLLIDSQEVSIEYYVVSEGESTSIVLSNAYAQSLGAGEHGFTIVWSDGEANGIISVNQNEDGTKRFMIVDAMATTNGGLMYRPKAGAVSKESTGVTADAAANNEGSNFDAVRTLVLVAVGAFIVVFIVNKFYIRRRMDFIEEF
ncbi:MAG: InlB B-repeat-containing protein [Candidatus Saccharibacteria bacterium]|nr:InlB B-repeat-containing protein [Candidatus Saccharibacteria bacterium]